MPKRYASIPYIEDGWTVWEYAYNKSGWEQFIKIHRTYYADPITYNKWEIKFTTRESKLITTTGLVYVSLERLRSVWKDSDSIEIAQTLPLGLT